MFATGRTYRARRAAVAAIGPWVAHSRRLVAVPDSVWLDPYFLGFLGMLITLFAVRSVSGLGRDDLATVQARAWEEITGLRGYPVGQEISLLSAAGDAKFEFGCRNAHAMIDALPAAIDPGGATDAEAEGGEAMQALWAQYFEAHLAHHPALPVR